MNKDSNYRVYSPYIIEGRWYREGLNIGSSRCDRGPGGSRELDNLKERIKELEQLLQTKDVHMAAGVWTTDTEGDLITITLSNGATIPIRKGLIQYLIQVIVDPSNALGGTVSGGGTYIDRDEVTISATPKVGNTFDGWYVDGSRVSTDANYRFTVLKPATYSAKFIASIYTINITPNSNVDIVAKVNGKPIALGQDVEVHHGDRVTLEATPKSGKNFIQWNGIPENLKTNRSVVITVDGDLRPTVQTTDLPARIEIRGKTEEPIHTNYTLSNTPGTGEPLSTFNTILTAKQQHYIKTVDGVLVNELTYNLNTTYPAAGNTRTVLVEMAMLVDVTISSPVPVRGAPGSSLYRLTGIPGKSQDAVLETAGWRILTLDKHKGAGPEAFNGSTFPVVFETGARYTVGAERDYILTVKAPGGDIMANISGGVAKFDMPIPEDKRFDKFTKDYEDQPYTMEGSKYVISGLTGSTTITPVFTQLYKLQVTPGTTDRDGKDLNRYYPAGETFNLIPPTVGEGIEWSWPDKSKDNPKAAVLGPNSDYRIITTDNRTVPTFYQFIKPWTGGNNQFDNDYGGFTEHAMFTSPKYTADSTSGVLETAVKPQPQLGNKQFHVTIFAMPAEYTMPRIEWEQTPGQYLDLAIYDAPKFKHWFRVEFEMNGKRYKGIVMDPRTKNPMDEPYGLKVHFTKP